MKRSAPFLIVAFALIGCKANTTPSTDATTRQTVAQEQSSTSYQTPSAATAGSTGPKLSDIPASLKTTAYAYYGLDNAEPVSMQMRGGPQGTLTGKRIRKLLKVTPTSAVFEEEWTDGLKDNGPSKIEVRPDGIYTTSAFGHDLPKPSLELPNNVKPGASWQVDDKGEAQGRSFEEIGQAKTIGIQKITVGGKTYDALVVKETGQFKSQGAVLGVTSQKWYVKGVGEVRESLQTTSGGTQNIVVEVTG